MFTPYLPLPLPFAHVFLDKEVSFAFGLHHAKRYYQEVDLSDLYPVMPFRRTADMGNGEGWVEGG